MAYAPHLFDSRISTHSKPASGRRTLVLPDRATIPMKVSQLSPDTAPTESGTYHGLFGVTMLASVC